MFAAPCAVFLVACAGPGNYVWVSEVPATELSTGGPSDYLIREGDVVSVRVFNQDNMSTKARVRSDGRIAVPVIGDIDVRGKRPSSLKSEIEARLKDYVNAPSVTISVEEFQPITVSVLGEVACPGAYPLDPRATVATVLATAGGLTEYATRDRIFVVRTAPRAARVRFTYEAISRGDARSLAFSLHGGDVVVVE